MDEPTELTKRPKGTYRLTEQTNDVPNEPTDGTNRGPNEPTN